jgi:hypothetical protein
MSAMRAATRTPMRDCGMFMSIGARSPRLWLVGWMAVG